MRLDFDLDRVRHIEFGVGVDSDEGQSFRSMMVDDDTQAALREMAEATWDVIQESKLEPRPYEPSDLFNSGQELGGLQPLSF